MRWLLPVILIGVAIGGYLIITAPIFDEVKALQAEAAVYEEALDNSANLVKERDRLTTKYNSFKKEDVEKLEKMLPSSVDNIQLILEIQEEASKRGIIVRNVEFEPEQFLDQNTEVVDASAAGTTTTAARERANSTRRAASTDDNKEYEAFELEFSVEGSYDDFVSFMKLMERSLRLIDINSITFTPGTSEKDKVYSDNYKYLFRINTYRLKD